MNEQERTNCPECDALDGVGRRDFLMAVGGTAVTLAGLEMMPGRAIAQAQPPAKPAARTEKPAEALIKELHQGLSDEQKRRVVYDWNHMTTQRGQRIIARKGMFNDAIFGQHNIGAVYTAAQQELNQRILRAIASDETGFTKLTRNGTFDQSGSFGRCGAYIFGDPSTNGEFAWVFSGHHITVRCDGNSEPDTGFGGPMYYGHSPDGSSVRNCFNYQTRAALSVWDALNQAQRQQATIAMIPVERREDAASVQFRREGIPGIAISDLTRDQRGLVRNVMRELLSPYRREDADEVMELVGRNGGLERIQLGFFRTASTPADKWDFWRLEGPGFVWNFRVLPHVHTFVNIALQPAQPAARG
jgi:hypothetical protein